MLGRRPVPGSRAGTHIPSLARKKNIKKDILYFQGLQHSKYTRMPCHRPPTHTHTRTHEASCVQYKSEAKTKKKQKKQSGETSLALRCVGHTHNAPDILHPACKQRDRHNLGWLSRPGDARFQIPGLQALELHAAACAAAPCCSAAYLRGGPAGRKRSVVWVGLRIWAGSTSCGGKLPSTRPLRIAILVRFWHSSRCAYPVGGAERACGAACCTP